MTRTARPLLWPLVPVYGLGLALRELQLRTGMKPVRRLRRPVVSVGSLSAGGAGKTPLTIALAKALAARGVQVDVLSRGYGRRRSTLPLLVDPGGTAEEFGDEPLLIAREAQVPVFVAEERYAAGMLAERDANSGFALHLLDDGFQHQQLHRDLDILLLSRVDLMDHLLPAGNLREAFHAAERADVIVIPADEPDVADWVTSQGWQKTVWRVRRKTVVPQIKGPVVAFCGIARPEQFFESLEHAGLDQPGTRLATRFAFPDHHRYTRADLERVTRAAQKADATALLTTEKDIARLGAHTQNFPASIPLKTIALRIEIENLAAAIDWLIHIVKDPA